MDTSTTVMKTHVYRASILNERYTLYFSSFPNIYLNVKCLTVLTNNSQKDTIQCFSYPDVGKTVVSYTRGTQSLSIISILCGFLTHEGLPLPAGIDIPKNALNIEFTSVRTQLATDYIVFSTHTHSFRIYIKENPHNYTIRIGGKEFGGCMEIFIDKPDHPYYTLPKLQQVYSEPECWHDLGEKGDTVDLIKGSLQLCQMLFGISQFQFEDASKIECGTTNMSQAPPRKFETPLSLPHLTLAKYGKTWYEVNFNAFLCDPVKRKNYKKAVLLLSDNSKETIDFEKMAQIARLSVEQKAVLKSFYTSSTSWRDFFSLIPKNKQCDMLLKWLPSFLDDHVLHFHPTHHKWCIWLDSLNVLEKDLNIPDTNAGIQPMKRTDLFIEMDPEHIGAFGGRKKERERGNTRIQKREQKRELRKQSRKQRIHLLSFSSS